MAISEAADTLDGRGKRAVGLLASAEARLDKVESWLASFTGFIAVAMVGAILFDVGSRAWISQSHGWGVDLTMMFMIPLTYLSLGYVVRHDRHVRVDFVLERVSPRSRRILDLISTLLTLCFAILWLAAGWSAWTRLVEVGTVTESVLLPKWWFATIMPIGGLLLVVELLIVLVKRVAALAKEVSSGAGVPAPANILTSEIVEADY